MLPTIGVNARRCQSDVSKCPKVIQNGNTEAVLLGMVDERADIDTLAAVSNARTY